MFAVLLGKKCVFHVLLFACKFDLARQIRLSRPASARTLSRIWCLFAGCFPSSRIPRWRPIIYLQPPYAIGSVPSLSGHPISYRWRSPPRVRRRQNRVIRVLKVVPVTTCTAFSRITINQLMRTFLFSHPLLLHFMFVRIVGWYLSHLRSMGLNVLGYQPHRLTATLSSCVWTLKAYLTISPHASRLHFFFYREASSALFYYTPSTDG